MLSRMKEYISKIKCAFRTINIINAKMAEVLDMLQDGQKLLDITEKSIIEQKASIDKIAQTIVLNREHNDKRFYEIEKCLTKLDDKDAYVNFEYLYLLNNTDHKILLAGFYGARNLGDELMMQKVYRDLNIDKSRVYVLMCDNPELNVFRYPGMNMLHYPKTRFDYSFLADQFECVVFGGGAIIDDVMYRE